MSTSSNFPRSVKITVHLDAIEHNYQLLRNRAQSPTFAVIKADAYGHGAEAVASYLSPLADGFAVVTVGEAVAVRDAGIEQPILVLQGPQDNDDIEAILAHQLWPALHDESQIASVLEHPSAADLEPWLKVDTGMGRLGVSVASASQHLQNDRLAWRGVLSHLASADDTQSAQTNEQAMKFKKLMAEFKLPTSLANSAGVLAWPSTQCEWSRAGIAMYGCHPVENPTDAADLLKPAMTVEAPIIAIRTMQAGQCIGYGATYCCEENMPVGYIGMGYADGLPRVLDVTADVKVQGVRCPIIGRVSMDSIAVDFRPLNPLPSVGDLITVWGPGQEVDRLASSAGTISYELLTRVRGQRTYTD